MKKKTAIFAAACCLCLLGTFSCDDFKLGDNFLEKAPGVDVTIDTVFSCKKFADQALNSAYQSVPCGLTLFNNGIDNEIGTNIYESCSSSIGHDNLDCLTDIIQTCCNWGGAKAMYYTGAYSPASENGSGATKFSYSDDLTFVWKGIRKAYLYMENVDRVPDMSDEEKAIRKAECKMIIASNYSVALRHIGGVPIFHESVAPSNQADTDFSRKTVQQVLDFICQLCDEAAEVLPWDVARSDFGRFNKASAYALKARVLLFCASPLFNAPEPYLQANEPSIQNIEKVTEDPKLMSWMGDYQQKRWQDAADACKAFIDANEASSTPFRLVMPVGTTPQDYRDAFAESYGTRCNGEIIMAGGFTRTIFQGTYFLYYFGCSYYPWPGGYNDTGVGYGGGNVTLDYVNMFQNTDGTPSSYADWCQGRDSFTSNDIKYYTGGNIDNTPFLNKDPRLYETVCIVGDHFRHRRVESWIKGAERGEKGNDRYSTGFHIKKYLWDYTPETFGSKPTCWAFLRLPEIYLSYAEALNELGRTDEALEWLNMTRRRVGMPDMTMALLQANQGSKTLPQYSYLNGNPLLREEILDERAREFALEDNRWFDIVRWKRSDIFAKKFVGIEMLSTNYSPDDPVKPADAYMVDDQQTYMYELAFSEPYLLYERAWQVKFSPKWYLSAFPPDEVNKGYGLVQNPGW